MGSFFSQVDLAPDVTRDMMPDMTHDGTPEHSGSRSALRCEFRCSSQENDCSRITHPEVSIKSRLRAVCPCALLSPLLRTRCPPVRRAQSWPGSIPSISGHP